MQVQWLMGAPAGLKLHAELSALLGGAMLAALHWATGFAARLAPLLPWLVGERPASWIRGWCLACSVAPATAHRVSRRQGGVCWHCHT